MGALALIGMGSNLGDRAALLGRAVAGLSDVRGVRLLKVSAFRETAPVGGPGGQGAFLNGAALIDGDLEPLALLDALQEIERDAGRVRREHWGARTLDLDLLWMGDQKIESTRLRVPHPRMAIRRFVLGPVTEIAPEAVDPETGRTMGDLLANLDRRPSVLALPGWAEDARLGRVFPRLRERLGDWRVVDRVEEGATLVARAERGIGFREAGRGIPVVVVEGMDVKAIVGELVTACEGTRGG